MLYQMLPTAREPYNDPPHRHDVGRMDVLCPFCGAYHWMAEKVLNTPMHRPEFTTCCQRGRVCLPLLPPPPPLLRSFLESDDAEAKDFRSNICQYNMALAFTSLGVTEDRLVNRRGSWVFRVQGELCHLIGSLQPDEGDHPSYAQLYIYDAQLALAQRMNRNDNLSPNTMGFLQTMLLQYHRYSNEFKHANEILLDYRDVPDASVSLRVMPGHDSRQYNLPISDEVAVILPGDGTAPERRDIVLRPCHEGYSLARINDGHPAYSPLHYVLLFPHGSHGWHRDLYHRPAPGFNPPPHWNPPRITQTQYSSFCLHIRNGEYPTIHRGGRLFQQYIVDMWASADQTRLAFLRFTSAKHHQS